MNKNTGFFRWMRLPTLMLCTTAIFSLLSLSSNAIGEDSTHVYSGMAFQQKLDFMDGKPKFQPKAVSTFLTLNVEQLTYYQSGRFFQPQNMAFGLKIGTMKYSGWYLSAMSNFNFKGAFHVANPNQCIPSTNTHSYFEALFGLTGRYHRSTSFHFGAGYFHTTSNYQTSSGSWGHIADEVAQGPIVATGLMFHIHGFVFSIEGVVNYNVHSPVIAQGFGYGAKVGVGFCLESKKKKKSIEDDDQVIETPANRNVFVPLTDIPVNVEGAASQPTLTKRELDSLDIVVYLPKPPVREEPVPEPEPAVQDVDKSKAANAEPAAKPEEAPSSQPKRNIMDFIKADAEPELPCGELEVKDVDGNVYHTVLIDNQCWMKENLRTTKFADGAPVPLGSQIDNQHPLRYAPNGDSSNVERYGYLYNWLTAARVPSEDEMESLTGVGVCPTGWHVPSIEEWAQLISFLSAKPEFSCGDTSLNIAKSLASKEAWELSDSVCTVGHDTALNNLTGFSALPAGAFYHQYGVFSKGTWYWSSSSANAQEAYDIYLLWNEPVVVSDDKEPIASGFSIRCLKD